MANKLETPCPMPRRGLPFEFKYDWAMRGWAGNLKAFLYIIRETYGATAVLEIFDMVCTMDDRIKSLPMHFKPSSTCPATIVKS